MWYRSVVRRIVQGLEDEVESISYRLRHRLAQLWRNGGTVRVIRHWRYFATEENVSPRLGRLCRGRVSQYSMAWARVFRSPCLGITTVTGTTSLLGNEEADVVSGVICSVKASRANDTRVI